MEKIVALLCVFGLGMCFSLLGSISVKLMPRLKIDKGKGEFVPSDMPPQWDKGRGFFESITKHPIQTVVAFLIIIALYSVIDIGLAGVVRQNSYDIHMLSAELLIELGPDLTDESRRHAETVKRYIKHLGDRQLILCLFFQTLRPAEEPCVANRKTSLLLSPARLGHKEIGVETGGVPLSTIDPKKEQIAEKHRKRVDFWKTMKWTIPVFLAIFSSFYIYRLTIITGPLGEMKAEIKHLRKENEKLNTKIEGLQNKLSQVKERALKNELVIENLLGGNTQIENLSEKRISHQQ